MATRREFLETGVAVAALFSGSGARCFAAKEDDRTSRKGEQKAAEPNGLRAGAAVADITPGLGISLSGPISKRGPAKRIVTPLNARAVRPHVLGIGVGELAQIEIDHESFAIGLQLATRRRHEKTRAENERRPNLEVKIHRTPPFHSLGSYSCAGPYRTMDDSGANTR